MQLKAGTVLQGGKYRIEKILGQGGFGITYLASIEIESVQSLGRIKMEVPVTIKEFFMKEHCNRDATTSQVSISSQGAKELVENFKRKFIKEAQTLAALEHPHTMPWSISREDRCPITLPSMVRCLNSWHYAISGRLPMRWNICTVVR